MVYTFVVSWNGQNGSYADEKVYFRGLDSNRTTILDSRYDLDSQQCFKILLHCNASIKSTPATILIAEAICDPVAEVFGHPWAISPLAYQPPCCPNSLFRRLLELCRSALPQLLGLVGGLQWEDEQANVRV